MSHYVIGVDIGGTHTDAVLIDANEEIRAFSKTATTKDISIGFAQVLRQLLEKSTVSKDAINGIFLGTTHATNAILQNNGLYRVGIIRIAGHQPNTLPVGFLWPQELKQSVIASVETISGGMECHGGVLTPFSKEEARSAIGRLVRQGAQSIAVIGVFSPLNPSHENGVALLIQEELGQDFPLTLSHEIGGIGFIERENSTILNAALKRVMSDGFYALEQVVHSLNITGVFKVTQNDGSLIDLKRAIDYPILTISSGPTNSFIGGARLSGVDNAIIVDIGGTSTDVGLIRHGFPVRSLNRSRIGGIALNFSVPDVLSIALGGGSVIHPLQGTHVVGPHSVGSMLATQSMSFGGPTLTLTDIALKLGHLQMPMADPSLCPCSVLEGLEIFDGVAQRLQGLYMRLQGQESEMPIVFVGGGAALLPPSWFKERYTIPPYFSIANAYGAALAEISGSIDTVVDLTHRKEVLETLHAAAVQKAIAQGADPNSIRLVEETIIPYAYISQEMARVIIRVCGKRYRQMCPVLDE